MNPGTTQSALRWRQLFCAAVCSETPDCRYRNRALPCSSVHTSNVRRAPSLSPRPIHLPCMALTSTFGPPSGPSFWAVVWHPPSPTAIVAASTAVASFPRARGVRSPSRPCVPTPPSREDACSVSFLGPLARSRRRGRTRTNAPARRVCGEDRNEDQRAKPAHWAGLGRLAAPSSALPPGLGKTLVAPGGRAHRISRRPGHPR